MNFIIMNKKEAIAYSNSSHAEKSIIISINNINDDMPNIKSTHFNKIYKILFLYFDDIDEDNVYSMSSSDGEKIVNFINFWKDKIDTIIVHCEAGQSRSAGVCAGIAKYMINDDTFVFDNSKYTPNMHCYRITLNSFYNQ